MIYSYSKINEKHWFLKFIFGIKFYMFRTVSQSIIRSITLNTAIGMCHTGFADSLLAGSGWNWFHYSSSGSILIPLASWQQNVYDTYLLLCTVLDSWWWTKILSETYSFIPKINFEKLMHLVGFIIRMRFEVYTGVMIRFVFFSIMTLRQFAWFCQRVRKILCLELYCISKTAVTCRPNLT